MKGPLSNVRVLAVEQAIAGPFGSMMLGDLGAEVIRIEAPEGEQCRHFAGPSHRGEHYYILAFNRNKKDLVLDLGTPTGKEAFYDLVKVSDVVWDNYRAGAMARLGIDYETLKKINPRIICCSITGFGSSGPYRDRPAYDIVGLAMSGFLSTTGEPGRPPVRPGPAIGDILASMFAAFGVVCALYERNRTGIGQKVEVSILDSCVAVMVNFLTKYFCSGEVPGPVGSRHLAEVPYGAFNTKEGYLVLGSCWPRIARALGAEWMTDDPRFKDRASRLKHRDELEALIQDIFLREKAEDWLEVLYEEDIPAAPVNTVDKVVVDPQVLHNKMVLTMEHPLGGEIKLAGNPVKMPGIGEEYLPPPTLGQHDQEILLGLLGYSEEKVKKMKKEEEENREKRLARIRKLR